MKRSYYVEDKDKTKTMQLEDQEVLAYINEGYRIKRRRPLMENNLYVTFGCRAGEMYEMGEIELPAGVDGEEELTVVAEDCIGIWLRDKPDTPFDVFIETILYEHFGNK